MDVKGYDRYLSNDCVRPKMVWISIAPKDYWKAKIFLFFGRKDKVLEIAKKYLGLDCFDYINPELEIVLMHDKRKYQISVNE